MVKNSLAPGFVRIFYSTVFSTVVMQHRMVLPVVPIPGTLGGWEVFDKGLNRQNWNSAIDAFIALVKVHFHTSTTFQNAELWTQEDEDSLPVFREAYNINLPGTNAGATVSAGQAIYSFRSTNGGRAKLTYLESTAAPNVRQAYGVLVANHKAVADYLMGNTGWVVARDGGYPNTFAFLTTKINDALRKHRMNL